MEFTSSASAINLPPLGPKAFTERLKLYVKQINIFIKLSYSIEVSVELTRSASAISRPPFEPRLLPKRLKIQIEMNPVLISLTNFK